MNGGVFQCQLNWRRRIKSFEISRVHTKSGQVHLVVLFLDSVLYKKANYKYVPESKGQGWHYISMGTSVFRLPDPFTRPPVFTCGDYRTFNRKNEELLIFSSRLLCD